MGQHKHTLFGKPKPKHNVKKNEEWCQTVEDLKEKIEELPSFAAMALKKNA